MKPRILFTTPVLHHPPIGGPALRIENSIKALSQIAELHLYSRIGLDEMGGLDARAFYERYCRSFNLAKVISDRRSVRFVKRAINFLAQRILGQNIFKINLKNEDWNHFLRIARTLQPDVIWLGYGNISYPLLKYIKSRSTYKVVVDTDSVWSRYVLRGLPYARTREERQSIEQSGKEKEEEERWGTRLADVTTAVSEVDAEYYRSLAPNPEQVRIFSNAIDLDAYRQVPPPPPGFHSPCVFMAGSFFNATCPMVDATQWIINQVLPLIHQQLPDLHLYIVGNGSERFLSNISNPNITVTGRVDSVLPYLCHSVVALVPLRFESGTRFKILEAGACGIPVVSTTLGAEGIPVTHGKDILIADEPKQFAESVIRLVRDRTYAMELGANLKLLVSAKNSIASLATEGQHILEYLLKGRMAGRGE